MDAVENFRAQVKDGIVKLLNGFFAVKDAAVRIRLPWSQKLYVALDEFERYTTILTNLKDDQEKFVQKSVGNNLNDLYKDAPEKADYIISQWEKTGKSKAQDWIIKHGRRNQK